MYCTARVPPATMAGGTVAAVAIAGRSSAVVSSAAAAIRVLFLSIVAPHVVACRTCAHATAPALAEMVSPPEHPGMESVCDGQPAPGAPYTDRHNCNSAPLPKRPANNAAA